MFAFDAALPTSRDTIRDAGLINWAARNSAKPGRGGPETWVVQANPQWSADHIEEPAEQVTAQLLLSLGKSLGVVMPQPVVQSSHRWRYAMSTGSNLGALWSAGSRIGVCGDWLLGPRVENAWLSGRTLASLILATVEQRAA